MASGRGCLAVLLGLSFEHTRVGLEWLPLPLLQRLDVNASYAPMTGAFGFARLWPCSARRQNAVAEPRANRRLRYAQQLGDLAGFKLI